MMTATASSVTACLSRWQSVDVKRLSGPQGKVEAAVHSKITIKLHALPVLINTNWRDLSDLHLADPEFGIP